MHFHAYYATDPGNNATIAWREIGRDSNGSDGWALDFNTATIPNQGNAGLGTVNLVAIVVSGAGQLTDTRAYRRVDIQNAPAPRSTATMYTVWRQENQGQAHNHLLGSGQFATQTFRATMPYLDRIVVNVASSSIVRVHLYTNEAQNNGWAKDVAPQNYGETTVVFDGPVPLNVGQTYYLQIYAIAAPVTVYFSNSDDHGDGQSQISWVWHGHDMNARVIGASAP